MGPVVESDIGGFEGEDIIGGGGWGCSWHVVYVRGITGRSRGGTQQEESRMRPGEMKWSGRSGRSGSWKCKGAKSKGEALPRRKAEGHVMRSAQQTTMRVLSY